MDTFLEILQNSAQAELLGLAARGGQAAEKSPNENRLPWRRRAPPRPPLTKGRPWDHPQPAPERPEATNVTGQPCVAAPRDMAPVDPFARGALRASAHPARAVAARSQRAHNLAESRTPARTRQVGLRGMGDKALCFRPKACCFPLWPGAQWHLTWRPPTPTRQNPIQTRQTFDRRCCSPNRRRQHASRAGVPDKRVVSPRLSKSECRAAYGGADGAAQVRWRELLRV